MRAIVIFCLMVVLGSCVDNSIPPYPAHLVPEDTFIQVLRDIYLVEAVNNHKISLDEMKEDEVYLFYGEVFARYDVEPTLFFESLEWYKQHPRAMHLVYQEALELLKAKRDEV